jgi:hypothetical protein
MVAKGATLFVGYPGEPIEDMLELSEEVRKDIQEALEEAGLVPVDKKKDKEKPYGVCKFCDDPATHGTIWADGRGIVKTCEAHIQKGIDAINENKWPEIVGTKKLENIYKIAVKAKPTVTIKVAPMKTEDGKKYPASDFAYVPDPSSPSTWKLRLTSTPGGSPDTRIVGAALAALGPGFRGNKVQIPSKDLAGVKAKVKTAWNKIHPDAKPEDVPSILKEYDYVDKNYEIPILKADEAKQLVTGVVLEPDTVDAHQDVVSAEEIERAAHNFMMKSRVIGLQHKKKGAVEVVESSIAPSDMVIGKQNVKKGSWIMTVKVHDAKVWGDVKDGKYTGFSIGGLAIRKEQT